MNDEELRRYYRTNDKLCFDYFAVHAGERLTDEIIRDRLLSTDSKTYQLLLEKYTCMETDIAEDKLAINQLSPELGRYLHHMNSKIELLAKALLPKHSNLLRPVNISLRGMAFSDHKPLAPDRELYVRLDLKPHNLPLILRSKVVYCHALKSQDQFKIALRFVNVTESKEQLLNQHMMLTQANLIEEDEHEFETNTLISSSTNNNDNKNL